MKVTLFCLVLFLATPVLGQINQLDENGKRHGVWKKNFDNTNILRYEGAFSHGKEIGLFKFYQNIDGKAVLAATREFLENSNKANVKFFASTGKLISEGQMNGKLYIGAWCIIKTGLLPKSKSIKMVLWMVYLYGILKILCLSGKWYILMVFCTVCLSTIILKGN